jgi:hypothetical protein
MAIGIEVKVSGPRLWPLHKTRYLRTLPQGWSEVPRKKRLKYFELSVLASRKAMRQVVLDLLHLPRRVEKRIRADELAAMIQSLDWMLPKPDCLDPVLTDFTHKGQEYILPKPGFENGTCLEFAIADDIYNQFRINQAPENLILLAATICREPNPDTHAALAIGDRRIPLNDRAEVDVRAKKLHGMPAAVALAVLYYFVGVKMMVSETYHELFDAAAPPAEEDEEPMQQASADGPRFGWWSIFLQVAKTGILGDYNQLLHRRLHLVCMTLLEQKDEAEKMRRAQEKSFKNSEE